jgi:hypothetical protein
MAAAWRIAALEDIQHVAVRDGAQRIQLRLALSRIALLLLLLFHEGPHTPSHTIEHTITHHRTRARGNCLTRHTLTMCAMHTVPLVLLLVVRFAAVAHAQGIAANLT